MNAHEALETVSSPAWSEPSQDNSTGVDFLGTRTVNLEMLTRLTGAYNNVVVSARQHAIVCWAAWRYRENCKATGTDLKSGEFRNFLDAVETIQLIGQRDLGEQFGGSSRGLGSDALRRLEESAVIPLRFEKYGRSHNNTSALAAVQYGPSAKAGSLDLLVAHAKIWLPTKRGEKIAAAIDPLLRPSPSYDLLAKFPILEEMALSAVLDLASRGLVIGRGLPDRPERDAYIEALFDLDNQPIATSHERRLTLALLLETAAQLGDDCEVADFRQAFLSGRKPDGTALALPEYLRRTAARWQLLQLRQLQRYCLEAWLYWVEWSLPGTATDFVAAVERAVAGVAAPDDDVAVLFAQPSGIVVDQFLRHRQIKDVLSWAATSNPGSPWGLRAAIEEALYEKKPARAIPLVLGLTMAVLALVHELVGAGDELGFARMGERRRISLLDFKMWWARRAAVPLRAALVDFLEELVLQQHVAVAIARFDNKQRRLRFSNDEMGWVALPGSSPAVPRVTPDRIGALLYLMADLALVDEANARFTLNDAGRQILSRVGERVAIETQDVDLRR